MKTMAALLGLAVLCSGSPSWADAPCPPDGDCLTQKEEEAIRLGQEWINHPIKPFRADGGRVTYVFGVDMPTVFGTPMQISDIELEAGEIVNEILVGDSARWLVESGKSGNSITHVFVKPIDAPLTTSLAITTNKRVYHLKLVSRASSKGYTPYVGFIYNEQIMAAKAKEEKKKTWESTEIAGQTVPLSQLDFKYKVEGRASWKPERVYNDGRQTFIQMPESLASHDIPVLLAMRGKTEQIINYRFKSNCYEVDGLYDHLALISGVGHSQERVDIIKRSAK